MSDAARLTGLTALEAVAAIASDSVSAVELVDAHLRRIDAVEPTVNAFITVAADEARESARRLPSAHEDALLHGVPVAIKDNIDVRGLPTTAGSAILADNVAAADATVVQRLRRAGAIVLGKANMHEFALGGTTENPFYGTTRNPWETSRFVAGSSGGSAAAVAAGEAVVALGTDTGGSVRLPAAMCGLVGLRPTIGRVSNHGTVPCAWSMDTVGVLARTVTDCALLTQVIAGSDDRDPQSAPVPVPDYVGALVREPEPVTVGVPREWVTDGLQPAVEEAYWAALAQLERNGVLVREIALEDVEAALAPWLTVHLAEPAAYHARWLRECPDRYGHDVLARLQAGAAYSAVEYIAAQRFCTDLRARLLAVLAVVDVILTPTVPFTAVHFAALTGAGAGDVLAALPRFTAIPSAAGLPALSIPCGFDPDGLPIGLQIIGKPFGETSLFELAYRYEAATAWQSRIPPLSGG